MKPHRLPIAVIKGELQGRVEALARELLPHGKRVVAKWEATNPTRQDSRPGSFFVWLAGPSAGAFKDYAGDDRDKGDILDLIRYVRGGDRGAAIAWASDWLGLSTMDPARREEMKRTAERRVTAAKARAEQAEAARRRRAFMMWSDAQRSITGTLAETYLASRGIVLSEIPNPERGELRFAPALEWWKGAKWSEPDTTGRKQKLSPGPSFPAMVAAIRTAAGEVTGIHCTFLAPDGSGKADVDNPKLMFGTVVGGVVRLTRGPLNERLEDATAPALVGVTEGIEDALTLAPAAPEARVWAATSLSNLANVPIGHAMVSGLVVAKDNDWNKPQALAGFDRAIDTLQASGKPVAVIESHHGKDLNDLLQGGGE